MSFEGRVITLAGLAQFDLPTGTLRFCDGGQVIWGAETFRAGDPLFGTIESVEAFSEESGDQLPGGKLTFLPASAAAAADLSDPAFQNAPMRFWLAEVDATTGEVTGTPELIADMELDTTQLRLGRGSRRLEMEMMPAAERLFLINDGNTLCSRFHQSVWPGETGLDNATGVGLTVAWGIAAPPRSSTSTGGGTAGAGGGGGAGAGGSGGYGELGNVAFV